MYRVIVNGVTVATQDELHYVCAQRDGTLINCDERDAQGIMVGETCYHLPGLPPLEGVQDAATEYFDGAAELALLDSALLDAEFNAIAGGDI